MNGEDALRERIAGVERMLLALRESDQRAIEVARADVQERMSGFPAEYAKKSELEQIRDTALRLDKTALSRESYQTAHEQLELAVNSKLSIDVFEATVREWTVWRRNIDDGIAERLGGQATWKQIAFFIGLATAILALVILLANNVIG